MICQHCKNNIPDNSINCPYCNTPVSNTHITPPPFPQPQMPRVLKKEKKNNTLITIIISATAIIICIIAAVTILSYSKEQKTDDEIIAETETITENNDNTETTSEKIASNSIDDSQYDWLSIRKVTAADLSGKTAGDLRLMRNSIFARHGYIFDSQDLTDYFRNFDWYRPTTRNISHLLNEVEKYNVSFIQKFEGKAPTTPTNSTPKKSPFKGKNIAFTGDYSDYLCYTYLSDSDLAYISKEDLRFLRNTIYARHGYIFKSNDLKAFFSQFSWYKPRYTEIPQSALSKIERHNIQLIQKYE